MKIKFRIECLKFTLNMFDQLSLNVLALFLVEYKPSKRKRAVGDIFDAKRAVRNHPEKVPLETTHKKCPARVSPLIINLSPLMTSLGTRKI